MSMDERPTLPEAAFAQHESMLGRKYGPEVANYFSGSPLNRLSFLRGNDQFLSAALRHRCTSFLLCRDLAPLVQDNPTRLSYASYEDVKSIVGDGPYGRDWAIGTSSQEKPRSIPQLVFLGIDERDHDSFQWTRYRGTPFFALDVSFKHASNAPAYSILDAMTARGLRFAATHEQRSLPADEAAIYAHARVLLDWNARNLFCAQCGAPTISIQGGTKRICPKPNPAESTSDLRKNIALSGDCATRIGVSNLSFPRTDPTMIAAVVSIDGQRLLLGRQKRWPQGLYSALAGFVEPAESIEDAVRREVWEESGVRIGRVHIHSTQPWPFPANLMIGAIAQAVTEKIELEHDPELEDAQWITLDRVRLALSKHHGGEQSEPSSNTDSFSVPPPTAIANRLLEAVVSEFLAKGPQSIN